MEIYQTSFLTELTHDLSSKLTLEDPSPECPISEEHEHLLEHQPQLHGIGKGNDPGQQEEEEEKEDEDDDDDDDDDFSFCCGHPDGSPVSAEDVFADGLIRPVFPLFNQSLLSGEPGLIYPLQPPLKRLFAEDSGECPRVVEEIELPSPGSCKKSNSTGSSKLCRFVDTVVPRSSSDGKDAFVFLRKDKEDTILLKAKKEKGVMVVDNKAVVGKEKAKAKVRKPLPSSSAGKGKATDKHRSYLPYRRDLLGFFTNSNLLSKNVHPF